MKHILITLTAVLIAGCTSNNNLNFSSISIGMDKDQVIAMNGKPYRIAAIDGFEYYIYRGFDLKLMFDGTQGSGRYEAFIRFKDKKVEAYGRLDDFDSTRHKEVLIKKTDLET